MRGEHGDLLQFPSFAFRGWIERSASICDRSRDDLAHTNRPMTPCSWRFVISSFAIQKPIGRGERRAHRAALGRVGRRRVNGRLRDPESS